MVFAPEGPDAPVSRTYFNNITPDTNAGRGGGIKWRETRGQKPAGPQIDKSAGIEITYADFLSHLAVGQDRLVRRIDLDRLPSGPIQMDVGGANGETEEVWNMPDISIYPNLLTDVYASREVTGTPYFESFTSEDTETGEITNASAAYDFGDGLFQYLDIFYDEAAGFGSLNNFGYADSEDIFQVYSPLAPIPIVQDGIPFEASLEGEPCALAEGGCQTNNPDEATFNLVQTFEAIAEGTLNTFDGESSPAIKLQSTAVITVFDDLGNEIEEITLNYVIWYSKDGHYVKAALSPGQGWSGQVTFDNFEYHKIQPAVLPVEWLAVNAEVIKNSEVKIDWSTATETQNERFIVERSSDGERFTSLAGLDAVGDSDIRQDYTYTDEAPQEGFNYYRIRQQDFNGMDTYSSIVSALITRTAANEELVVVYPNPGRNEVFFSQPADYELMTVDGQLLSQGRAEQQLDVTDLPAGIYLVRIDGGEAYRWVKR